MSDFSLTYNGLQMGPGTPYGITAWNGFGDLAGARQNFTSRARSHGAFAEPRYIDGALYDITFDVAALGSTTFNQAVLALQQALVPIDLAATVSTLPLTWQLNGQPMTANVQVLRRAIPVTTGYEFGIAQSCGIQWYAPDPKKYGPTQSPSTGLPHSNGGLSYPLTYPLTYGTGSAGRIQVTNTGSAPEFPTFTVSGFLSASAGFQITSLEDGVTITSTGLPLGPSDQLVIDCSTGSVILDGVADRRAYVSAPVWPSIPAGATRTYAFTTASGAYSSSAQLTVTYAPAYW